eukprot:jgi/Botrbrau1/13026/Bobra.0389s0018.3
MYSVVGGSGPSLLRGTGVNGKRQHRTRLNTIAQSVQTLDKPSTTSVQAAKSDTGSDDVYIGFEKGDYAPRIGRKGRFVKDDPSKYPDRSPFTGGWAGGEAGLKAWVQEYGKTAAAPPTKKKAVEQPPASKVARAFGEPIYLGFGKDELEERKAGQRGRVIKDDPLRYPDKETIGPLTNVVGGFAGGERGLKLFVEEGDFIIADPEQARKQFSPLVVAAIVSVGVTAAALLLNSVGEVGEQVVGGSTLSRIGSAPVDDNTKTLLYVALGFLGMTATVAGVNAR